MKTCEPYLLDRLPRRHLSLLSSTHPLVSHRLRLVSDQELQDLGRKLARGQIPADLEAKLVTLSRGDLAQRSIEQNCRIIIALLQSVGDGSFKLATSEQCQRLLLVLAYVRKDDDAIPDYRSNGFTDDQQELRAVSREYDSLLQTFKRWRLQHQVPAMWLGNTPARYAAIGHSV
jgi:hypothetical protein